MVIALSPAASWTLLAILMALGASPALWRWWYVTKHDREVDAAIKRRHQVFRAR